MILLTGGKGYVGSHLCEKLSDSPGGVVCFDESDPVLWARKWADLRAMKFDTIVHCGAYSEAWSLNPNMFWSNVETTRLLLENAQYNDTHFVYFSSCAALDPINFYGWSKKWATELIKDFPNVKSTILYPYQIFGKEHGRPSAYSVPTKILTGDITDVFEGWMRDYIHIDDVVSIVTKIVAEGLTGEYDLGTGIGVLNDELFYCAGKRYSRMVMRSDPDFPFPSAHTEIVARKNYMMQDFVPTCDVRSYMYCQRDMYRKAKNE